MHMVLDLRQDSIGESKRIGHGNISRTICLCSSSVPASKSAPCARARYVANEGWWQMVRVEQKKRADRGQISGSEWVVCSQTTSSGLVSWSHVLCSMESKDLGTGNKSFALKGVVWNLGSATSISYPEIGFWVDIEGVDSNVCYHGCGFCTRTKGNAVVTVLRLVLPRFRERRCVPARPLLFWKSLLLQYDLKQHVLYKLDHKLWLSALLSQFYNGEELVLIQPSDLTWLQLGF